MDAQTRTHTAPLPGLVGVAQDGRITTFSTTARRLLGFAPGAVIGRPFNETLMPPRSRGHRADPLAAHARIDEPTEVGALTVTGQEDRFALLVVELDDGPTRYVACFSPLTDADPDPLPVATHVEDLGRFSVDDARERIELSDSLWRTHGLAGSPRPFTIQEYVDGHVHPDDRAKLHAKREQRLDVTPQTRELVWRIVRPDGDVRRLVGDGWVSYGSDGTLSRVVGIARDVTASDGARLSLEAHRAVERSLAGWSGPRGGLVGVVRALVLALDWLCGGVWVRADDSDALVCRAFWIRPEERPAAIEASMREATHRIGHDLAGDAWVSGEVMLSGAGPEAAPRAGPVVVVPLVAAGVTIAVLQFRPTAELFVAPVLRETLGQIGRGWLAEFCASHLAELGMSPLTERERQVLQLAADGGAIHTIATALGISPSTVKTHFEHIYRKLAVSDRGGAVAQGFRQGLIT